MRTQSEHLGVVRTELARFHDEQDHIHIRQSGLHGLVQIAVQGGRAACGVARLESGGVDEDELGVLVSADASDAVTCGLRLTRCDRHFLADQSIQQSRLTDIGASNDGHHATTLVGRCGSLFDPTLFGHAEIGQHGIQRRVQIIGLGWRFAAGTFCTHGAITSF